MLPASSGAPCLAVASLPGCMCSCLPSRPPANFDLCLLALNRRSGVVSLGGIGPLGSWCKQRGGAQPGSTQLMARLARQHAPLQHVALQLAQTLITVSDNHNRTSTHTMTRSLHHRRVVGGPAARAPARPRARAVPVRGRGVRQDDADGPLRAGGTPRVPGETFISVFSVLFSDADGSFHGGGATRVPG